MTIEQMEEKIKDTMKWCQVSRPDFASHAAEAIYLALAEESGELAEHHEAGRFWNASSGEFDTGGCW